MKYKYNNRKADQRYEAGAWQVLLAGGKLTNSDQAGLVYLNANNDSSNSNSNIGAHSAAFYGFRLSASALAETICPRGVSKAIERSGRIKQGVAA